MITVGEVQRAKLMDILVTTEVKDQILVHGSNPKSLVFNDDGTVTLYSMRCHWFARMIRKHKTMEISKLLLDITNIITGIGGGKNNRLMTALCLEIIDRTVKENDYDSAIDAVYDTIRYNLAGDETVLPKYFHMENDRVIKAKIDIVQDQNVQQEDFTAYCRLNSGEHLPFVVTGVRPVGSRQRGSQI